MNEQTEIVTVLANQSIQLFRMQVELQKLQLENAELKEKLKALEKPTDSK